MASLSFAAPPPVVQGFHSPSRAEFPAISAPHHSPNIHLVPSNIRFKNILSLCLRQRSFNVVASHSIHSGEESSEDKSDGDGSQGPPFLTILAGLVVFVLICWVVGSIALWLIGLFVKLLPMK